MTASEKLRALDEAATPATWDERAVIDRLVYVKPEDGQLIATLRNALPLIADVVEAAEAVEMIPDDHGTAEDWVRDLDTMDVALTALREHLEEQ